jgi:hypothetical protein
MRVERGRGGGGETTKPRQEHQVSRCFYFEKGADEDVSGVTDGGVVFYFLRPRKQ